MNFLGFFSLLSFVFCFTLRRLPEEPSLDSSGPTSVALEPRLELVLAPELLLLPPVVA